MTTNHHTPITNGAAANSSTINGPLSELDTELTAQDGRIGTLEGDMPVPSGVATEYYDGLGGFTVPAGTGASVDGHLIKDEGVSLPQRASIDFVGAGVTVTNEAGGTQVSIPGDHGGLTGLGDDDHPQYIKHALATAVSDFLVASGAGVFVKKTLAEVKTILGLGTAAFLDVGTTANKVVQLDGSAKLPAVDGSQLTGIASGGVPVARVMATSNVNISTALENGDTLNGVVLATGNTVLLTFQTASAENGLYTVAASGAASRHASYSTWTSLVGLMVAVSEGTVGADTLWLCKANTGGTINSTAVTFQPMSMSAWRAEYTTYSSFADSGGTVIPWDDTIPQVTEGSELMSLTFTPMSDTIEIETAVPIAAGVNDSRGTVAIFKDGGANAIAASTSFISNSYIVGTPISCERRITVTPGVQVVISVRIGPSSGTGTLYVNGNSAARKYGGVSGAWLKVREVRAGA